MATLKTTATHTQACTLYFNPKDRRATQLLEALKVMDFLKVEDSPYDKQFVAKIKSIDAGDKRKFKAIKSQDVWK